MVNGVTFAVHSLRMACHDVQTLCHNLALQSISDIACQYSVFLYSTTLLNLLKLVHCRSTDLGHLGIEAVVASVKALYQFEVFFS